jgi:hypothetical protein
MKNEETNCTTVEDYYRVLSSWRKWKTKLLLLCWNQLLLCQEEDSGDLLLTTILTSTIAFIGKAPMPAIVVLDAEEICVKAEDIAMWKDLIETANLALPLLNCLFYL